MDWLRSEDLKEEKNVTAPKSYYSSPSTLSLPNVGCPWDTYRINSQYLAADLCDDLSSPSDILLREEPEDEEEDEEKRVKPRKARHHSEWGLLTWAGLYMPLRRPLSHLDFVSARFSNPRRN
jgi:hypothetical protein